MGSNRRPIVIGNWKMNGLSGSSVELAAMMEAAGGVANCDVMICPPMTLVSGFSAQAAGSRVGIGAQDCHAAASGAHTGDVSAEMIKDAGATAIIVGHSERRADHGETDAMVHDKAVATHGAGLVAIICVGETEAERDAGQAESIVGGQLKGSIPAEITAENTIIAYEPVWAIGTGRTPTPDDVQAMHQHMRDTVSASHGAAFAAAVRLLYGGSVKPTNAVELMALEDVDGALVGGASLVADDFLAIAASCSG